MGCKQSKTKVIRAKDTQLRLGAVRAQLDEKQKKKNKQQTEETERQQQACRVMCNELCAQEKALEMAQDQRAFVDVMQESNEAIKVHLVSPEEFERVRSDAEELGQALTDSLYCGDGSEVDEEESFDEWLNSE